MELIKKFTAMQLLTKTVNNTVKVKFEIGDISGPYYAEREPVEEFNTEEEAIEWAYKENKHGRWLIVPIITFKDNGEVN